jgi:hypothetical protein
MQRIRSTDSKGLARRALIETHWHVQQMPPERAGATGGQNTTGDPLKRALGSHYRVHDT